MAENAQAQPDVFVINADGTNMLNLTQDGATYDRPAWSPDGTRIAFTSYRHNRNEIFVMNADGSNQQQLTATPDDNTPVWSPDSTRIAFVSWRSGTQQIFVMNADGTNQTNITNTAAGQNAEAAWSPDGSRIVFISTRNGQAEVFAMNPDGSGLARLTNTSNSNFPAFSPDGQRIAFVTSVAGQTEVFSMNPDGSDKRNLSNYAAGPDDNFDWRPRPNTPAGASVTFTSGGITLNFANVTQAGNTTVTPIDPATAGTLPGGYALFGGSTAYEIKTTAVNSGPVTLSFSPITPSAPYTFADVRVLHGESGTLVDRTVLAPDSPAPDPSTQTVSARVTSLSPFVIAARTNVDHTPPVVQINAPADVVYLLHQAVIATYSCTDTGSGIAQCAGPIASGALVNTSAVGSFSFTVNARDNAGNTSSKTVSYRVAYAVNPLFDQSKAVKSGSTLPIKLQLTDVAGANQSSSAIVVTAIRVVQLSNNAPGALQDAGNANPDFNFRYDAALGGYVFNLKTTGYATGTYRLDFQVSGDPVTHSVQFQVK